MGFSWFAGLLSGFVYIVVLLCCSSESEVVTVDVQEAKHLLESGYGYLEVRTEEEYKKGHVDTKKILNIPYMFNTPKGMVKNPQFLEEVSSACNKDDLIVVGCQSGVRSLYATADLLAAKIVNEMIGFQECEQHGRRLSRLDRA
ncbi:thiosulfate sulfurtransferase 18-like isoform X3 [Malus sylvestris]|uniref:thiosulfate sulfurtransferase 18-like isoform X3 n=1 Tax=Malus sylvestris TaxID=3752 RepID=UPI0021ABDADA|nr:thiosulfate sulfurtransferase 18-like isoform X3 [Malus sylvestris]